MPFLFDKTLAKILRVVPLLLFTQSILATESALWTQFKQAKLSATEPTLPDFSYAGYNYSETPIPDTSSWTIFDVTDYGAVVNDGNYDDASIQATIDAAQAAGGGIVSFPAGRLMLSPNTTVGENIFVTGSNILLRGSGSGEDGTILFKDKMKVTNGRFIFEIGPTSTSETTLTTVVSAAPRQSYTIEVADASSLSVGQRIVIRCTSITYAAEYYSPQIINPDWERISQTDGFNIRELHTVEAINGNTITLREPLHLPLILTSNPIEVRSYNMIVNIGIEDIQFKGNWDSYPESFVHHKNDIHDYAWNAIRFDNVENGWMRNCDFKDWNQAAYFDGCAAFTVENVIFSGKKGHTSIHTRRSYGILIKDCQDTAGHHHGPGVGYWGCGTVYLRYQMAGNQRIDAHSGSPYATLMDGVTGGHFDGNGGPYVSYPHHGRDFVAWNFNVDGGTSTYDFWPDSRNGHTFSMPIFAGLQGQSISLTAGSYQVNESPGSAVEPASLFEAQLQFRLGPTVETISASSLRSSSATANAKLLSAGQGTTEAGFYWGSTDGGTDPQAWANFQSLGSVTVGAISAQLSNLNPDQTYWYRAWSSNSHYEGWASDSVSFTTNPVTAGGSILNPANFAAIEQSITSATPALTFDTDTLQVSGGLTAIGHYGVNQDGSLVSVFPFLAIDLSSPPVITGNLPFVLMSETNLRVNTSITVDGGKGSHAEHGIGISGGGDGGDANRPETPGNPLDGQGPGGSLGNSLGSDLTTSGGAGFGGSGGDGGDGSSASGSSYGDAQLSSLIGGSGAGGTLNKGGGAGGGAIGLVANETLEVTDNATIRARGGKGTGSGSQLTSGGGSGGAILLRGEYVIINGTLDVSGGNGGNASGGQLGGGGGSGGRIAIYYHRSLDTTNSTLTVSGGQPIGTSSSAQPGADGTIYTGLDNDGLAAQWLNNETSIADPTTIDWSTDYDNDGLSARLEYSLGGSTTSADTALLPNLSTDTSGAMQYRYSQRQSGIDPADYIVNTTTTLDPDDWTLLVPQKVEIIPHPTSSGYNQVTVTLPSGELRRFIQLRIRQ